MPSYTPAVLSRDTIVTLGSKLAPSAVVLGRLRLLMQAADTDLEEIVNLIRLDPALTFHVIRMSNSILFGVRERNDSLEGAVSHVGYRNIYQLVGLAATRQVCQRDLAVYRLRAGRLWENAVATAAAAEVLALPAGIVPGLAYATGLLRSIGRVIIDAVAGDKVYPGEAEWPLVADWERATFGITSTEVTAVLLDHWRFPAELVDAVRVHHEPFAEPASNVSACVLNLACGVSARFGLDLPGEVAHWHRSEAKLTLAGVTEQMIEDCTEKAWAHYLTLCASVV
jgi:HD-like signal output (HDOD) protein